jgi:hypothetical protein
VSASTKASAAADEYNRTLNAARAEVYQQIDDTRKSALDKRAQLLAGTRDAVGRETQSATARVAQESAEARAGLDRNASDLANAIVLRVLKHAVLSPLRRRVAVADPRTRAIAHAGYPKVREGGMRIGWLGEVVIGRGHRDSAAQLRRTPERQSVAHHRSS